MMSVCRCGLLAIVFSITLNEWAALAAGQSEDSSSLKPLTPQEGLLDLVGNSAEKCKKGEKCSNDHPVGGKKKKEKRAADVLERAVDDWLRHKEQGTPNDESSRRTKRALDDRLPDGKNATINNNPGMKPQAKPNASNYDNCPMSCEELNSRTEQIYAIRVMGFHLEKPFLVPCRQEGMVIMRRGMTQENFYRSMAQYKKGFGDMTGDFFIGLEKLYAITTQRLYRLGIIMMTFNDEVKTASYDAFAIGSEEEFFNLKILGNYSGNAGDGLRANIGMEFTTKDVKRDTNTKGNCAVLNRGAWWYSNCGQSNLHGVFETNENPHNDYERITWHPLTGKTGSLKEIRMLLKPAQVVSYID